MRLALIVEYEGTNYHGFQFQVNAPSIQEEIEKAITGLTGENVRLKGAGRTDAGVHAVGQVVAFNTDSSHTPEVFVRAMNYYLPDDIAVKAAHRVTEGFDPRRDALSRSYKYTVLNSSTPSPLRRRNACIIDEALDEGLMQKAAEEFTGDHDFRRFCGPLENKKASTVRHIESASVSRKGEVLEFDVTGNAFLPHQVRRMAGALVDIGRNKLSLNDLKQMIHGGHTEAVAHSLPPQGLCLMNVTYADFPPEVGDTNDDGF